MDALDKFMTERRPPIDKNSSMIVGSPRQTNNESSIEMKEPKSLLTSRGNSIVAKSTANLILKNKYETENHAREESKPTTDIPFKYSMPTPFSD